jgi:hypothetical protein
MVEHQFSKLIAGVRFSHPALTNFRGKCGMRSPHFHAYLHMVDVCQQKYVRLARGSADTENKQSENWAGYCVSGSRANLKAVRAGRV